MYAKLINGYLIPSPPTLIFTDGECICNPTADQLLQQGYKPVREQEEPDLEANQYFVETLTESESEIQRNYEVKTVETNPIS